MSRYKSKNKRYVYVLLSSFLLIPGCSYPREKIINDVQLQSALSFDKAKDGYVGTVLYSDYTGEEKEKGSITIQGQGRKIKLIRESINAQLSKPIENGKLTLLIFGKDLAENGISYFVTTFCKDPLIGSNIFVAVSEGSAGKVLNNNRKNESHFLYKLIEQNYKNQNLPNPNMQSFLYDFYGEGIDIAIPYLIINSRGKTEVDGLAVFQKDKLALVLNQKEALLVKMLKGRAIRGETEFQIHKGSLEDLASLTIMAGNTKRNIQTKGAPTKITFHISIKGVVKDYPEWLDLMKKDNNVYLQKELEKQIEKDLKGLLMNLQEHRVDPVGIGDLVRAHSRNWNEREFYEKVYPHLVFDLNVKVKLSQAGIGE